MAEKKKPAARSSAPKVVKPLQGAPPPQRDPAKAKEFATLKLQERLVDLEVKIEKATALSFTALATRLEQQKASVQKQIDGLKG